MKLTYEDERVEISINAKDLKTKKIVMAMYNKIIKIISADTSLELKKIDIYPIIPEFPKPTLTPDVIDKIRSLTVKAKELRRTGYFRYKPWVRKAIKGYVENNPDTTLAELERMTGIRSSTLAKWIKKPMISRGRRGKYRRYTDDEIKIAVQYVIDNPNISVAAIAKEFGVRRSTLYKWIKKYAPEWKKEHVPTITVKKRRYSAEIHEKLIEAARDNPKLSVEGLRAMFNIKTIYTVRDWLNPIGLMEGRPWKDVRRKERKEKLLPLFKSNSERFREEFYKQVKSGKRVGVTEVRKRVGIKYSGGEFYDFAEKIAQEIGAEKVMVGKKGYFYILKGIKCTEEQNEQASIWYDPFETAEKLGLSIVDITGKDGGLSLTVEQFEKLKDIKGKEKKEEEVKRLLSGKKLRKSFI